MGKRDSDIPLAYLNDVIAFDISSPTLLRWKHRPREHFEVANPAAHAWEGWNAHYAGKPALTAQTEAGYRHGCLTFNGKTCTLYAHRVICALLHGRWPVNEIDHINGNRSDNTPSNLREATHIENGQNNSLHSNNTSGFLGVRWDRRRNKWKAEITVSRRRRHLGYFETAEAASAAYIASKTRHHPFSQRHGAA
jgi:hypothetical protein